MGDIGSISSLVCFFFAGFVMPLRMGPIQALVQMSVRGDMQGRIFSIMECVSTSVSPLSLMTAGRIFDVIGPEFWYRWGGITAIAIALFGFAKRSIRNLGAISQAAGA